MSAPTRTRRTGTRTRAAQAALLALAATATSVLLASPAHAADTAPYRATVLEHGYDTAKVVTLSFDADWSDAGVASVLNTLKANGITAAFSLTGRFVERYPASTRTIMAAGSKLVNHSYDHPYFSKLTQAQRWSELNRAEAAYNKLGYSSNGWFRAPYRDGYADPGVNRDLALDGYYISFDWTFDTTGYNGASTATILSRVRQYVRPGAIIVMHPGEGSTDPAALPQVISTLKSLGYGFTNPYLTVTHGAIGSKYAALGAQRSLLGPARTVEMPGTVTGSAIQWFAGGRVYYSWATGAHEVNGAILGKFVSLGSVNGFVGYPRSDETAVTGGRASQFQGANIYWSGATGAHEVNGAILGTYLSLGGTASRLGLPTSDEHSVTGGRGSDFQHGALVWNSATGAVTVSYF
ncbi:polysaccharide deacetylase family protein [Streptacidiphilus rugosus]|uniref:polysaccharide deacetylase family protein n=1 Tax=Streptacidiphilus rugosus TaxID=405783 RepID=UPI00068E9EB1|nr:polysaccharide deacetylase family protein [Streptacidiphilus rugosus]